MADVNKLVFSILKFLEDQKRCGQLDDKAAESLKNAVQCLEKVYKLNTSEEQFIRKYSIPQNLLEIFSSHQYETKSNISPQSLQEALTARKEEAERLKNKGNEFMKSEKYSNALESYSQAIRLDARNAVYFCNRAAAFSKLNKHQQAIEDCNRALVIDPSYSKAYGRMGFAYTALQDHKSALECYRKAIELDPDNQRYQNNLNIAEQELKEAASQVQQMMMTNLMSGSNPPTGGGFAHLLQASQQMLQTNPELIQHLGDQMRVPNPSINNSSGQNNSGDSNPSHQ